VRGRRLKKVVNFLGEEKCTPRENPGYAYDLSTYCIYIILAYLAVLLRLAEVLSLLELHELQDQ